MSHQHQQHQQQHAHTLLHSHLVHPSLHTLPPDLTNTHTQSQLTDAVWLLDLEFPRTDAVVTIAKTLGIQKNIAKQRWDAEFLEKMGMVKEGNLWKKKEIRMNTAVLYKQQIYNLMREVSEGYAKLLLLLISKEAPPIQDIIAVIGYFDLDPNRVADMILDAFISSKHRYKQWIALFRSGPWSSKLLSTLMGWKFRTNVVDETAELQDLYLASAILLKESLIDLSSLFVHLLPKYEVAKDGDDPKPTEPISKSQLNANASSFVPIAHNQKLGVLKSLLALGDLDLSLSLLPLIPESASDKDISWWLCRIAHDMLSCLVNSTKTFSRTDRKRPSTTLVSTRPSSKETFFYPLKTPQINNLCSLAQLIPLLKPSLPEWPSLMCRILQTAREGDDWIVEIVASCMCLVKYDWAIGWALWEWANRTKPDFVARWSVWYDFKAMSEASPYTDAITTEVRKIMRRLSTENVKQQGRALTKMMHTNPITVLGVVISQVQMYESLGPPIADAMRYLSPLAEDALVFLVVVALSQDKDTVKIGAGFKGWVQYLSSFCGNLFKKYRDLNIEPLLIFLMNRLRNSDRQNSDLLVLKELVNKMAGVEAADGIVLSAAQYDALAGGDTLRTEAAGFKMAESPVKIAKRGLDIKSKDKLAKAVLSMKLIAPILITVGRQRSDWMNADVYGQLRPLADHLDWIHETFMQVHDFISTSINAASLVTHLPLVPELVQSFGLSIEVAFHIARPSLNSNITQHAGDNIKSLSEAIPAMFAHSPITALSASFIASFWRLGLYDIYIPETLYKARMQFTKSAIAECETLIKSTGDIAKQTKARLELKRNSHILENLDAELTEQTRNRDNILKDINEQKEGWIIAHESANHDTIATDILQHCIIPRSLFSANDASFTARFLCLLHTINTPRFSMYILLDKMFTDLSGLIFSCTHMEAASLGRFLREVLTVLAMWSSSEDSYQQNAFEGFSTIGQDYEQSAIMTFEDFGVQCSRWQYQLYKAFNLLLTVEEHMHNRNALVILNEIVDFFPAEASLGNRLVQIIKIKYIKGKKDSFREEMKTLAMVYNGNLTRTQNTWKAESKFQPPVMTPIETPTSRPATPATLADERTDKAHEDVPMEETTNQVPINISASPESITKADVQQTESKTATAPPTTESRFTEISSESARLRDTLQKSPKSRAKQAATTSSAKPASPTKSKPASPSKNRPPSPTKLKLPLQASQEEAALPSIKPIEVDAATKEHIQKLSEQYKAEREVEDAKRRAARQVPSVRSDTRNIEARSIDTRAGTRSSVRPNSPDRVRRPERTTEERKLESRSGQSNHSASGTRHELNSMRAPEVRTIDTPVRAGPVTSEGRRQSRFSNIRAEDIRDHHGHSNEISIPTTKSYPPDILDIKPSNRNVREYSDSRRGEPHGPERGRVSPDRRERSPRTRKPDDKDRRDIDVRVEPSRPVDSDKISDRKRRFDDDKSSQSIRYPADHDLEDPNKKRARFHQHGGRHDTRHAPSGRR